MAAIVFTATADGSTAGQSIVAATRTAAVTGLRNQEWIQIETSDNGSAWCNALSHLNTTDGRLTTNGAVTCPLPAGWSIRITVGNVIGTGAIRVAIE